MLRASVSPSFVSGIQENAANQNLGENSFSRTATQSLHDFAIVGQHTLLIGANKVNELRYQYARHPVLFAPSSSPGGNGVAVNIPGFAYFGKTPFSVVDRIENQNQLQDNFTITRGNHTFKMGVDLRYIPINLKQGQLYGGGDYTFAALNATDVSPQLAGLPGFSPIQAYGLGIPQSFAQGIGLTTFRYDLKVLGAFLQDSWRVTPRSRLNAGLRYDVEAFPTQLALNAATNAAERPTESARGSACRTRTSPRASAPPTISRRRQNRLRANYGLFYDRAPGNLEAQSIVFDSDDVPLVILAGGAPCTAASTVSPLNLNATNTFQGSLSNANCLPVPGLNYLANQQRFDPDNRIRSSWTRTSSPPDSPLRSFPPACPRTCTTHALRPADLRSASSGTLATTSR